MRRQALHPRTAALNQKQKNASKRSRLLALHWLASTFPQAFDNSVKIRPLKIGIIDDILAFTEKTSFNEISNAKLREAVALFTRRVDYLSCLKAREMRIDLEGEPVNLVTEEEAEKAASKLKKRIEKSIRNARKAALQSKGLYAHRTSQDRTHTYGDNSRGFSEDMAEGSLPSLVKGPFIKHKAPRAFDPTAVARLKEKLGLSRASIPETTD